MIFSDHYTFGKNRLLNLSAFDYICFHKTIQDSINQKVISYLLNDITLVVFTRTIYSCSKMQDFLNWI